MKPALLVLDMQRDFLARPGLEPHATALVSRASQLLEACRGAGVPVLYVHTRIRPDGSDRMPHWKQAGYMACVEGTPGARAPEALRPRAGEPVFVKRYFNAFGEGALAPKLTELGADTLILAGVFLHACVRATAIEAYERGLRVLFAEDAIGTTDPAHGELSRVWLADRVGRFHPVSALIERINGRSAAGAAPTVPVGRIGARWVDAVDVPVITRRNPADREQVIAVVPVAGPDMAGRAVDAAAQAWREWRRTGPAERREWLQRWRDVLERSLPSLEALMVREIGKPAAEAREELERALAHVAGAARIGALEVTVGAGVTERHRPHGCCALVTPWNNPVAIPVGKIAPALAFGNTVVWKPSPKATLTARAVMETLLEAGMPDGLLNLVCGGGETARDLIRHPGVAAVSLTGSVASGRSVAALCSAVGKPLQAELGGNNACIVLADADPGAVAGDLARAAFGYAGQRCTALRRFIVERTLLASFERLFTAAVESLAVGDPARPETCVGPLIDDAHRELIEAVVNEARAGGARVLCGGTRPPGLEAGSWYAPTVLTGMDPGAEVVMRESFGPVAVVLPAADLDEALALANAVPQGLLAGMVTDDAAARARFEREMQAGILRVGAGPPALNAHAPFGGWKASGIGPPEHGEWDRVFYTRPQAVYGDGGDQGA